MRLTGFEGDCAERSEVKTVRWTVFKEGADDFFLPQHAAANEMKAFRRWNTGYQLHQEKVPVFGYLFSNNINPFP